MSVRFLLVPILGIGLCAFPAAAAIKSNHAITALTDIPIANGTTTIEKFSPDGRDGIVLRGWRGNGNAKGYDRYMVMLKTEAGAGARWNIVTIQSNHTEEGVEGQTDTIRNDPLNGNDTLSAIRFAHAKVDGNPETLLVVATRDTAHTATSDEAAPVQFEIYRLVQNNGDVGRPSDYFDLIDTPRTLTFYCNADLALTKELGFPLPPDFSAPNQKDGCYQ